MLNIEEKEDSVTQKMWKCLINAARYAIRMWSKGGDPKEAVKLSERNLKMVLLTVLAFMTIAALISV